MKGNKKIAIKGEVVSDPSIWTSASGTPCCKFTLRNADGIYECIAFHERANIEGLAKGKVVSIRGSYKDQEAFEGKSITIDTAIVEGGKTSFIDMIIRDYGSVENYKSNIAQWREIKEKAGFVEAKYTQQELDGSWGVRHGWFKSEWCSMHPLTREMWLSIELCMNVLGSDVVAKEIRKNEIDVDKGLGRYREVLDGLLLRVADALEGVVPF